MAPSAEFTADLIAAIPLLRRVAFKMCRCAADTDDAVQETVLRALTHHARFEPGTNMRGWLLCIMRNEIYNKGRRARREMVTDPSLFAAMTPAPQRQDGYVALSELGDTFSRLSGPLAQAVYLVAVEGMSYDEAAAAAQCPVGTMKSRVSRGRDALVMVGAA